MHQIRSALDDFFVRLAMHPVLQHLDQQPLTEDEEETRDMYTGENGFRPMNNYLRNKDNPGAKPQPLNQSFVDELDSAINKSTTNKPLVVYRGSPELKGSQVGDVVHNKGYSSTSLSHIKASKFGNGHIMKIEVPQGHHGIHGDESEQELILPRDTSFQIHKITNNNASAVRGAKVYHSRIVGGNYAES